jgi:hypothetical protein
MSDPIILFPTIWQARKGTVWWGRSPRSARGSCKVYQLSGDRCRRMLWRHFYQGRIVTRTACSICLSSVTKGCERIASSPQKRTTSKGEGEKTWLAVMDFLALVPLTHFLQRRRMGKIRHRHQPLRRRPKQPIPAPSRQLL